MSRRIILRGDSGSRKTIVAKELQKKFMINTMIISYIAMDFMGKNRKINWLFLYRREKTGK